MSSPKGYYKYCPRLGQVAVELGFITGEQLKKGLDEQVDDDIAHRPHKLLGEIFVEKGWMTNKQVLIVLNKIFGDEESEKIT